MSAGASSAAFPHSSPGGVRQWGWWAAAVALAALAYGPLATMFFRQQWAKPHYQHFPFIIGAFAWLLWSRASEAPQRVHGATRGRWLDAALLILAVGLLAASIAVHSPWGGVASLLLLVGYCCRLIARRRHVPGMWAIWMLLWLMMPLPFNLDQKLISRLQIVSSQVSSYVLDAVGVDHLMDGNVLTLLDKQLFVDEACSGIVSILSIVACAAIFAVYMRRSVMHLVLLAVAGVFWATLVNVARISTIAYVYDRWGVDWTAGAPHEILSLALFLVTFVALLSTDRLLQMALDPVASAWYQIHGADIGYGGRLAQWWDVAVAAGRPRRTPPSSASPPPEASLRAWTALPRTLAALLAVPAVVQSALVAYAFTVAPQRLDVLPRARNLAADFLPKTLAGLEQVKFTAEDRDSDNVFGNHSRMFEYRDPATDQKFTLSFDFPFAGGFHELSVCYTGAGWNPVRRDIHREKTGAEEFAFVEASFDRPTGQQAFLAFSEFDQFGDSLEPYVDWLVSGRSFLATRNIYLMDRHGFQVQVFVAHDGAIPDADRAHARALLLAARERFRALVVEASTPGGAATPAAPAAGDSAPPAAN